MIERRDRKRRNQRLASFIVAVVVGAGSLGAGGIFLSGLGQDREDVVGSGWQPSRRLALRPGEYFYLRIESSDLGDGQIRDEETWWGANGSGEVRNGGTRQDKYPYPPAGLYEDGDFPIWLELVPSLSTDPALLAAQLREDPWEWGGGPEPERLWDLTGFLLLETPYATPELRAALFEVASDLDGVTLTADVLDPADRPAVSLEFSNEAEGATWALYFDPGTHQPIAWTFRSTRGGYVWQVLESGIVDRVGGRPEGEQWLVPKLPPGTP
jgi:hypothetical protein